MTTTRPKGQTGSVPAIESEQEREDGEDTKRVKRVVHDEIAPTMKSAKRLYAAAMIFVGVAAAGFLTANYLQRYATAAELEKLQEKQVETQAALAQHMINEAAKLGAVEAQGKNIESDYHSIREQLWRIADRTGSPRVSMPDHDAIVTPLPKERHP